jgi:hypothetical protein
MSSVLYPGTLRIGSSRRALHVRVTPRIASSSAAGYFIALFSRDSVKLRTIFILIYFCLHSPTAFHPTWNLRPGR